MNVVGHQAEAKNVGLRIGQIISEKTEPGEAVGVRGEGLAAVDASLGNVAGLFGVNYSFR